MSPVSCLHSLPESITLVDRRVRRVGWRALVVLLLLLPWGCNRGSEVKLVQVTGTVLFDGQPLPDARVVFQPTAGGRPSLGTTGADGSYTLRYMEGAEGAITGPHKVLISTFIEPDTDSSDPVKQAGRPERIPAEYNTQSTLTTDLLEYDSVVRNYELVSKPIAKASATAPQPPRGD